MELTTTLDRDRYFWVAADLNGTHDAVATIVVEATDPPRDVTLRMQVGSAMRAAQVSDGAGAGGGSILDIGLGRVGAGDVRRMTVRFSPRPASRPGRRRVAVVQVVADAQIVASTTIWARVERQPPSADKTSGPPTRLM